MSVDDVSVSNELSETEEEAARSYVERIRALKSKLSKQIKKTRDVGSLKRRVKRELVRQR